MVYPQAFLMVAGMLPDDLPDPHPGQAWVQVHRLFLEVLNAVRSRFPVASTCLASEIHGLHLTPGTLTLPFPTSRHLGIPGTFHLGEGTVDWISIRLDQLDQVSAKLQHDMGQTRDG